VAVGSLVGYLAYRGGRRGGGSVIGRFYWEEGILGIRFILVGYKGHHVVERT